MVGDSGKVPSRTAKQIREINMWTCNENIKNIKKKKRKKVLSSTVKQIREINKCPCKKILKKKKKKVASSTAKQVLT